MRRADGRLTREALAAGVALARRARREAAAPLAVTSAGWTAVFVAGHATLPPEAASALGWTGLALVLLMAAPKLGALHRLAAGAEARDPPGPWGLQWTPLEPRLAATATALAAAGGLLGAALGAGVVLLREALGGLGEVAGPFGTIAAAALVLCPATLAAAWSFASVAGRFCVCLAADAAETAPPFSRGWRLTRGAGAAPAVIWILTFAVPTALLLAVPAVLDLPAGGAAGVRTVWGATPVGLLLAVATQFLCAPLNAGALARLRRAGSAVDTAGALGDKAAAPLPAAAEPLTA